MAQMATLPIWYGQQCMHCGRGQPPIFQWVAPQHGSRLAKATFPAMANIPATKRMAVDMPLTRALPAKGQGAFTAADGNAAVWSDMLLLVCAVAVCCMAQPYVGSTAAGWGAVTVCVVTELQTDATGARAIRKGMLRLVGTLLGGLAGMLAGPSWLAMAVWASFIAFVRRQLRAQDAYACTVAVLTYGVVALGQDSRSAVMMVAGRRILGVATGCLAVFTALLLRALLYRISLWSGSRRLLREAP
mmetsp:Transcript_55128/g.102082  ORF Transcript_55128/g.102082 Transcript_55128/m.102082 type:complete len:245 (+) Transcript_55128:94-828(+)